VLNYGNGFFGKNLPGAELVRLDHVGATGNRTPTVTVAADQLEGPPELTVQFTSTVSDPEGRKLKYAWDFDADGTVDSRAPNPTFTYTEEGLYRATLQVTDQGGRTVSDYVEIIVGERPTVNLEVIVDANGFQFGDTVQYTVTATDDDPVDCNRVSVTYILGHDTHGHPLTTAFGCTGSITTSLLSGHDPATDDLHAVFVASYTDEGSGYLPPLTGTDEVVITPTP
jgi:PKD repeat protein